MTYGIFTDPNNGSFSMTKLTRFSFVPALVFGFIWMVIKHGAALIDGGLLVLFFALFICGEAAGSVKSYLDKKIANSNGNK